MLLKKWWIPFPEITRVFDRKYYVVRLASFEFMILPII